MAAVKHGATVAAGELGRALKQGSRTDTGFKLFQLAAAYACQAVPIGFCWVGLPVIFRQTGAGLQVIGWLSMLYLPWALKFLWAPWIDRCFSPKLGRRRTWIFPLQWLAAALLALLALFPPMATPLTGFLLMVALNLAYATNDIAVDGYATDILAPRERAWGNSAQMGSMYIGHMIGGGGFVMLYGIAGWQTTMLAMAGLTILLSLPIALHPEIAPAASPDITPGPAFRPRVWSFLKARGTRPMLFWLLLVGVISNGGMYMLLPLLTDLGYDSRHIGSLMLLYGSPCGVAGAVLGGIVMRKLGARSLLYLGGLTAVGLALLTVHIASEAQLLAWEVPLMLAVEQMMLGGLQVLAYTTIMDASAGPQSGTNYAVLCSYSHVIFLSLSPLVGAVADALGYQGLYTILAVVMALFLFAADAVFRRIPSASIPGNNIKEK